MRRHADDKSYRCERKSIRVQYTWVCTIKLSLLSASFLSLSWLKMTALW